MGKGYNSKHIYVIILNICLSLTGITGAICAQDTIPEKTLADTIVSVNDSTIFLNASSSLANDTIAEAFESAFFQYDDSVLVNFSDPSVNVITENKKAIAAKDATNFKPNPKIAWKAAILFPGFGQIYNRQYWKLPIIYGGLMGFIYAITWNNKTYQDYKTAYFDIVEDSRNDPNSERPDSWSNSWQVFVPSNADLAVRLHDRNFHNTLKRGKDYYRRYRDLSIILCAGIYMIFVADAYVDAQMFDFDISPELSFRVTPEFRPETISGSRSFGVNICMTF